MSKYYVACDLTPDSGRVILGTLNQDTLTLSDIRRFRNVPVQDKDSLQWNIPQIYQELLAGLSAVGTYEEAVDGISCDSWAGDYLLFESDASLITPAYHYRDPRGREGMQKVLAHVSKEALYQETGVQPVPGNTLFQLAAEKGRRIGRAQHLMPVADAFNYLLSGVPGFELSMAGATQLYNPTSRGWSTRLFKALDISPKLFPPFILAGTELGPLQPEIARSTHLEDACVLASCSNEAAAALAGLPILPGENWAYLRLGPQASIGTELPGPVITEASRNLGFSNEPGQGGTIHFSKQTTGLWMLEECRRFWKEQDREIDNSLLSHLAGSAPPFESLINPADPRFQTPGEMPLKVQAFCRETLQPVPRKPGPIIRCILESLALSYRQALQEIEDVTGRPIARVFLIGGAANDLLNHFIANAVRRPLVMAAPEAAAIGSIVVQALAMRHLKSLEQAREIVRKSIKMETLLPYATAWDTAFTRLSDICCHKTPAHRTSAGPVRELSAA
jgi:rhamnulokinase